MRLARLLTAAACLLAGAGVTAPATTARASTISLAAPGRTGGISDISCPSTTSCWAVGTGRLPSASVGPVARLMHFNGEVWKTVGVPVPAKMRVNGHLRGKDPLTGITCVSTRNCWAVGSWNGFDFERNRALHWDGKRWADVPVPTPTGSNGRLLSVACTTGTSCWASATINDQLGPHGEMLHWNGHVWRPVLTPVAVSLTQMGCDHGNCWAAGQRLDPANPQRDTGGGALYRLVHDTWTSVLPPVPDDLLSGAACPSLRFCWLSGWSEGGAYLWHWDGKSVVPKSVPAPGAGSGAVSCLSATSCWLSGPQERAPRMYHWNGQTWKAFVGPTVVTGRILRLTCASATLCFAAGTQDELHGGSLVLLRWNGKHWTRTL